MMGKELSIIQKYLTDDINNQLNILSNLDKSKIQEIRLRSNKPLSIIINGKSSFIGNNGDICNYNKDLKIITSKNIVDTFSKMCQYSVHTYINQIKNGFITLEGGHRVGISGHFFYNDNQNFNIKEITSLNIRIAKEYIDCGKGIADDIFKNGISGLMIIGSPSSGKTTILRDLARLLSSGYCTNYYKVAVVDTRNEISGFYKDNFTLDVGICTDVIVGCEKAEGILKAIRVLSPDVIICDEVGNIAEVNAIIECLNSGVSVITSAHASNEQEINDKLQIKMLLKTGAFKNVVLLESAQMAGKIKNIGEINNCDKIDRGNNDISNNIISWYR